MSYYILVSMEISCIQASIRVENQYNDFVMQVMQDREVFIYFVFVFILYDNRSLDPAAF